MGIVIVVEPVDSVDEPVYPPYIGCHQRTLRGCKVYRR